MHTPVLRCFTLLAANFLATLALSAKPPLTSGESDPVLLDLDPYMIEALRGDANAWKDIPPGWYAAQEGSIVTLMQEADFQDLVNKHDLQLFNGPMLGTVTDTSARFWVRTAGPATFRIQVGRQSKVVKTSAETDFTGIATVEGLVPSTDYSYSVLVDGNALSDPSFHFRTYPQAGARERYTIAFGACSRYVPLNEGIWRTMATTKPLAYLGLGDNLYIDAYDRPDVQRLHYYRRMLRKEYRELIAQTSMYAIWDDHDFGMNDSAGGPSKTEPWKLANFEVFKQNWNNPFYGAAPETPGTWHNFRVGDVEVFMVDGRMYRSNPADPEDLTKTMLGPEQKAWLFNALERSTATFKVLASSTMWHDLADKGGKDSWAGPRYRQERDEIYQLIQDAQINGVVFLSGDRHRTEIWKTERVDGYPFYEFVSAKVTNMHTHNMREEAEWSHNEGNFWGALEFDFTTEEPTVTFKAINQEAEELKRFTLKLNELSF